MASSSTIVPNFLETVRGRKSSEYEDGALPLAASTPLSQGSGRFMTIDGNGNYALSGASSTKLDAWAYTCHTPDHTGASGKSNSSYFIASATDGLSVAEGTRNIHTEDDAVWMYSVETLTLANRGLQCDLVVTSSGSTSIQQVKPSVTTNKVVQILDVDLVNNLALVYAIK